MWNNDLHKFDINCLIGQIDLWNTLLEWGKNSNIRWLYSWYMFDFSKSNSKARVIWINLLEEIKKGLDEFFILLSVKVWSDHYPLSRGYFILLRWNCFGTTNKRIARLLYNKITSIVLHNFVKPTKAMWDLWIQRTALKSYLCRQLVFSVCSLSCFHNQHTRSCTVWNS